MDVISPAFRRNVLNHLMEYLYGGFDQYKQREIEKLDIAQAKLTKTEMAGFRYRGKRFRAVPHIMTPRLDSSLYPQMEELLNEEDKMEWHEKPRVQTMLQQGLKLCRVPKDLFAVFPQEMHSLLRRMSFDHESLEMRVNPADVVLFHTKFKEDFELVRKRMITNLVMN